MCERVPVIFNRRKNSMTISLYDTYERKLREFVPINGSAEVGMYCCGPTVYNYAHIGNLRTYIFEDILRRALETHGYTVRHVMNITDVGHLVSDADDGEDKMETGAARTGKTAVEIAEIYTEAFLQDLSSLNILMPHILCKATDHIEEQISCIQEIEKKGYTYRTSDGIYFDTSLDAGYGYLARLDVEGLRAGARISVGDKRQATDFALWKFSPVDQVRQMEWDSPWGKGFPGWHIECSAMAAKYLGPLFDIHCGGKDHIPIHHSNEIAQSSVCYGTRLANYWMHGYFLQSDKEKMSKSSGEFLRIPTVVEHGFDPLAYRFLCLLAHYRSDISFSWDTLASAQTALDRLRQTYHGYVARGEASEEFTARFFACIYDDLNTSQAIAVIWELIKSELADGTKKATLDVFDKVLGLQLAEWEPVVEDIPSEIVELAEQRTQARQDKNWAVADKIRDELLARGYEIKDSTDGATLRKIR